MQHDWTIQGRATQCAVTGEPFKDGEFFYTLLFDEVSGYRREDLSDAAWKARPEDAPQPFSFWRSKFEVPPPAAPEALGKQTAEDLLRRYMSENTPEHRNVRYILALMLERKRLFKQIDRKKGEDGQIALIYEHTKTGEVFVIPDPELKLEQIADVQAEIAPLLGPG
ncbi:hypothetical protein ACXR0O_18895 [Verrucomicrobiota bacterium sgz303538]